MRRLVRAARLLRTSARALVVVLAWLSFAIEMAVAAEPVRIGVSLGLTGQYEQPSYMQLRAYELWRDDVNARGGLLGRPVELVIRDDGSDSMKARDIYRGFMAGGRVDHVFGPYSSGITAAVAGDVDAAGFPMLAAGASADGIWSQGYHNIFGMWTPASRYTQGMLRLAREAGLTTVAVLHADDAFSNDIAAGTLKWAPYLKLKVVAVEGFAKDKADLSAEVSRARTSGAELLVVAGHLNEALNAKRQIIALGWMPRAFFATVGPALPEWSLLNGDAEDRTFATSIWEPNDSFPRSREFAAGFKRRYGVEASYHAATAYAAGEILEAAANASGTLEHGAIREALFSLDTYSVLGRFAVDRTGMQVKRLDMLIQWQDGRKEIVWPEEMRTKPAVFGGSTAVMRFKPSLQLVIFGPALALILAGGLVLYFLVLRSISGYADENIRSTLESLLRNAVTIADSEVDRQNREGNVSDTGAALAYQLNTRIRLEDFARDQAVGVVVIADDVIDFATGMPEPDAAAIATQAVDGQSTQAKGGNGLTYFVASARFAPWNWQIVLAKDAGDFETLIGEVRRIYIGSALALLVTAGLLLMALRQFLVRPIYRIAEEFGTGGASGYRGISEFEHLSTRIGEMVRSLQAKTQQLETILQSMSDAITVYDADLRLSAWNRQYETLYRYPDALLRQGTPFADIMRYAIDRGDFGRVDPDERVEQMLERARSLSPPRFEIDRADGISIEVRRAPMPGGGFVTTYTDITRQKQSARLEAANEAKSRFLENMSHDLRKPIAAVIEDCRLLVARRGDALDAADRAILDNVSSNAGHLLGMVDDLLEMARIEAGQVKVKAKPFTLHDLSAPTLRVTEPAAKSKGLALTWEESADAEIHSDARLLLRILINLVSNAIEYTESGSVKIHAQRRGDLIEISVADTGPGIPPEKCSLIFEKFQRLESTSGLTKPGIGLGLGLPISREFARLLGGDIVVDSQPGRGSTFTLRFPASYRGDAR